MAVQKDKLAVVVFAVFVAAVVLFVPQSASEESDRPKSVASTQPNGRAALFMLLRELELRPEMWSQRPGTLPSGAHFLWVPELPPERILFEDAVKAERDALVEGKDLPDVSPFDEYDPLRASIRHGLRGPRHYRRFVQSGGTLLLAVDESGLERLRTEFEFTELAGLELRDLESEKSDPDDVLSAQYLYAEPLTLEWGHRLCFATRDLASHWNPLVTTGVNDVLALEIQIARGHVILLASDEFLDNRKLGQRDHSVLAVRLAERNRPGGRLLFDEYALGAWQPQSAFELAFFGRAKLLTLHLVVLLLLCAWHLAWVREFPRDAEPHATAAPLLRARAQAALYVRARRFDLLARDLRGAVLRRVTARLKLARGEPDESGEVLVERMAHAAGKGREVDRWRELLLTRRVASAAELERLETELAALEIELAESTTVARGARGRQAART